MLSSNLELQHRASNRLKVAMTKRRLSTPTVLTIPGPPESSRKEYAQSR